jgi:hypothetical protein
VHGLPLRTVLPNAPSVGLVAFATTVVMLIGGGPERWRFRPLLTFASGLAAMVTAAWTASSFTQQYALEGRTSTLLMLATTCSIAMLPLVADETYAALARMTHRPQAFEPRLYHGALGALASEPASSGERYAAGLVGILVGLWLLFSPVIAEPAVTHTRVVGVLACIIGALSLAAVARPIRWLNVALGMFVLVTPLVFGYGVRATIHAVLAGIILAMGSSLGESWHPNSPPERQAR